MDRLVSRPILALNYLDVGTPFGYQISTYVRQALNDALVVYVEAVLLIDVAYVAFVIAADFPWTLLLAPVAV